MPQKMILTGDVNLMNVDDPAVPFRKVAAEFKSADAVFELMRKVNRDSGTSLLLVAHTFPIQVFSQ